MTALMFFGGACGSSRSAGIPSPAPGTPSPIAGTLPLVSPLPSQVTSGFTVSGIARRDVGGSTLCNQPDPVTETMTPVEASKLSSTASNHLVDLVVFRARSNSVADVLNALAQEVRTCKQYKQVANGLVIHVASRPSPVPRGLAFRTTNQAGNVLYCLDFLFAEGAHDELLEAIEFQSGHCAVASASSKAIIALRGGP